jgi:hypothetical protein
MGVRICITSERVTTVPDQAYDNKGLAFAALIGTPLFLPDSSLRIPSAPAVPEKGGTVVAARSE